MAGGIEFESNVEVLFEDWYILAIIPIRVPAIKEYSLKYVCNLE
jgi:hypothetical protein